MDNRQDRQEDEEREGRRPYQPPAIVYRGKLETYASVCNTKFTTCHPHST